MTSSVNYLVTESTILLISVVFLPVRAHTAIYLLSPCKQTTLKYELQYTHTDTNKRTHTVGIAHSSFSYFSYFTLSFFLREFKVLFPLFYFPHFHLYGMILSSSFFLRSPLLLCHFEMKAVSCTCDLSSVSLCTVSSAVVGLATFLLLCKVLFCC